MMPNQNDNVYSSGNIDESLANDKSDEEAVTEKGQPMKISELPSHSNESSSKTSKVSVYKRRHTNIFSADKVISENTK